MIMLYVCLILLIAFMVGYLFFQETGFHSEIDASVLLPVSMSVGLSLLVIGLMFLSLIYISYVVTLAIVVLLAIGLVRHVKRDTLRFSSMLGTFRNYRSLLPLIILFISIWRFSYIVEIWGWAPLFDSMTHGTWVGLIQYHNRIPFSTYPVGDIPISPIRYPMGLHVLGAFFGYVTGLYPGQIVVILGTCFVSLLPLIMFSIIYLSTRSQKLSLAAFLLCFFLPGGEARQWAPSHDLLLGNFIVGTYANLLGNLILLTIIAIEVFFDHPKQENNLKKQKTMLRVLLIVSLGISYYPLVPFVILYFVVSESMKLFKNDKRDLKRVIPIMAIILGYLFMTAIRTTLIEYLHFDSAFYFNLYHAKYPMFTLDSIYLVYSVLILAAVPIAIWAVLKKQKCSAEIFFLALAVPLMLSQSREFYLEFLWFVQLDRLLIVTVAATYIVIIKNLSVAANRLSKTFTMELRGRKKEVQLKESVPVITLVIIVVLLVPSFLGHSAYFYPADLQENLPHDGDLDCMKWLSANVENEDLILNDITTISMWLTAVETLHVVNSRQILLEVYFYLSQNNTLFGNQTRECNEILADPWDYGLVNSMADKYGLKYIYISGGDLSQGFYVRNTTIIPPLSDYGITQESRLALYDLNPNLEVVYESGMAAVFWIDN